MSVSETNRLDMLAGLRTHLGDFVADTLMEHLPPGGWYDIARTSDIDRLRGEFVTLRGEFNSLRDEFGTLRGEFNSLRTEVRSDIQALTARLDSTLKWIIGMCITTSVGTLGTLVTVLVTLLKQ